MEEVFERIFLQRKDLIRQLLEDTWEDPPIQEITTDQEEEAALVMEDIQVLQGEIIVTIPITMIGTDIIEVETAEIVMMTEIAMTKGIVMMIENVMMTDTDN